MKYLGKRENLWPDRVSTWEKHTIAYSPMIGSAYSGLSSVAPTAYATSSGFGTWGYSVTASSELTASYSGWRALNPSTYWQCAPSQQVDSWVSIEFATPQIFYGFNYATVSTVLPNLMVVEASPEGTSWTELVNLDNNGAVHSFASSPNGIGFNTSGSFTHYRVRFPGTHVHSSYVGMAQLQFYKAATSGGSPGGSVITLPQTALLEGIKVKPTITWMVDGTECDLSIQDADDVHLMTPYDLKDLNPASDHYKVALTQAVTSSVKLTTSENPTAGELDLYLNVSYPE